MSNDEKRYVNSTQKIQNIHFKLLQYSIIYIRNSYYEQAKESEKKTSIAQWQESIHLS